MFQFSNIIPTGIGKLHTTSENLSSQSTQAMTHRSELVVT